jgi:hypothetical protein
MCSAVLEPAQEETKFEKDKKQAVFAHVPGGCPESAPKNFFWGRCHPSFFNSLLVQ